MATDKSFFGKNKITEGKYSVIKRRRKRDTSSAERRASVAALLLLRRELNKDLLLSKTDAV